MLNTLTALFNRSKQPHRQTLRSNAHTLAVSFFIFTLVLFFGAMFSAKAFSQANFVSFQKTVPVSSGLIEPFNIAVDASGDLYIVDIETGNLFEETPKSDGSGYNSVLIDTIGTPGNGPTGVAIDSGQNIYLTGSNDGNVYKETLSGGSYTRSIVASGYSEPYGIALDVSGNIYITCNGPGQVIKITPTGGSYISTPIASSADFLTGIAIDAGGNIYYSDTTAGIILLNRTGSGFTPSTYSTQQQIYGLALDAQGNLYGGNGSNGTIVKLLPTSNELMAVNIASPYGLTVAPPSQLNAQGNLFAVSASNGNVYEIGNNFGGVSAGQINTTIQTVTALFQFTAHEVSVFSAVTTQGRTSSDFTDAGTGTCSNTVTYSTGDYCTVDIQFAPTAPGVRTGSVALVYGYGGSAISTPGYVQGTGFAPYVNFPPGTIGIADQVAVDANSNVFTKGIAIDSTGYLYAEEFSNISGNNHIVRGVPYGGWESILTLPNTVLPAALAVDGYGDLLIAATNGTDTAGAIYLATPGNSGYTYSVLFTQDSNGNPFIIPYYIAVDANENFYFTDFSTKKAYVSKFLGDNTWATPVVLGSGFALPAGIAVDANGVVYIVDNNNNSVVAEIPTDTGYYQATIVSDNVNNSQLDSPSTVTVDSNLNLYVTSYGNLTDLIYEESPVVGGFAESAAFSLQQTSEIEGWSTHVMDAYGNFYMGLDGYNTVLELDRVDTPNLSFLPTPVNQVSSDSPKSLTMTNWGNAPLEVYIPGSGTNPVVYGYASDFSLNSSITNACPVTTSVSPSPGYLYGDESCIWSFSFEPQSVYSYSAEYVVHDDNLNAPSPGAVQVIYMEGIGTTSAAPIVDLTSSANPSQYLSTVTFVATVNVSGGSTPTGTVTFKDGTTSLGTQTLNSAGTATLNISSLSVGSHPITAVYSGNSTYPSETSSVLTQVIDAASAPTVSLGTSVTPALVQTAVTFTSTVKGGTPTVPVGTMTFKDGTTTLATITLNSVGTASFTTSLLAVGSHSITANYSGDSVYPSAVSSTLVEVILPPSSGSVLLASTQNPAFVQNVVTFIASVTQTDATVPTGTITFYDGSTSLGTFTLNAAASTSISTSTLAVGSHSITASYSGDTVYPASTSAVLSQQIVDFTLVVGNGTSAIPIVKAGGSLAIPFTIAMVAPATTLPSNITLVATGGPDGSTYTFSPTTVTAGSGSTSGTLTINIPIAYVASNSAPVKPASKLPIASLTLALLLLPMAGRMRKAGKRFGQMVALLLLAIAGITATATLTGCGANTAAPYEVTVTASSGSLSHSSTFTITAESH
jgi:sugar lactone lactonase YvrE